MCNQCSFQVALRNLRSKHHLPRHHAGEHVFRNVKRGYTSASLSQTASSATAVPLAKPFPFVLPPLQFLSQSYSIWSSTSSSTATPLPPSPSEILKNKPFSTNEEIASLLYSLARHPKAFTEIDKIICPTLEGLLSVHHYAGARAVLERVLDEIVHLPEKRLPLGRKLLHKLVFTLQGLDDFHRKPKWELHSLPAMRPMLSLVLQYLIAHRDKFSMNTLTVKVLVAIPEYLDTRSISLLLELFDDIVKTDLQGESLSRNIPTLHNIMRVYALHGHSLAAEQWMNTILEVQQSMPQPQRLDSSPPIRSTDEAGPGPATALRRASASLKRNMNTKSSALYLGTTYLSSLAQPESKGAPAPAVDSRLAMTFFQELWKPNLLEDGSLSEEVALPPEVIELDIYAWSAIIHAAALDLNRVSSQTLVDVLHALEKYPSLPKPSAVPYTAVMGGLNKRGDYQRAIDLFEHEIIPKAISRIQSLQSEGMAADDKQEEMVIDAQLLGAVVLAWTGLGDIGMAVNTVKWFGSTAQSETSGVENLGEKNVSSDDMDLREKSIIEHSAVFPEALRGSVKVDTILINQLMTYLGQTARYNSVYNLFASMTDLYSVYPDETTLTILARTALSVGKMKRNGLVPDFAEDVWQASAKGPQEDQGEFEASNFFMNGFAHLRHALGRQADSQDMAKETGVWDGVQPVERVLDIYWAMLEQNVDSAHQRAVQDNLQTATRSIFHFGRAKPATPADVPALRDTEAEVPVEDLDEHILTSRFQITQSEEQYVYRWPSLCPTSINMHMLIALSGYFGRGSDIPLILSHMKQLNMKPTRRTLCLSLWSYEETGVYASEFRKFRQWLVEWLGETGVPADDEVGAFRARQWSGNQVV
ncbi:hypothetical protein P389DRAFT_172612 [Cystobasidium minutum MCA 4210]|uniref:uncharacterized protein n=1 Tax=Cystobasidium minutum MCA 4210 TaxID=1397322 RepID=UPI0034CDD02D|eukprot:jgi/Rhomi1/172612/fgenesh1_kg.5_\